jgi:hypothetical protein
LDERFEGPLRSVELPFDLAGRLSQGRGVLIGGFWLGGEWVSEKCFSSDAVRCGAVGRHKGLRFAGTEGMAADGVGQAPLLRRTEGAEGQGHGEGEAPGVQPRAELGREAASQKEPALHPGLPSSQELRDRRGRQSVLLGQRRDHPGLVHGAYGLSGRVGLEDSSFPHDARDRLEDHGDLPSTFGPPLGHAFESVEDLEASLLGWGDAKGQGGKRALSIRALAPQRGEAGLETIEGDIQDQVHRAESSTGRIWKRG